MDKYDIGGFATWEKNDEGKSVIRYSDDGVKRLNNRNLEIVNVIIEHSVNYDNFITAAKISEELENRGLPDFDRDTIKKALQRIRKDRYWKSAIVSTANGYLVKYTRVVEDKRITAVTRNTSDDNVSNDAVSDGTNTKTDERVLESTLANEYYDSNELPAPKGKPQIIDKEPIVNTQLHNQVSNPIFKRKYSIGGFASWEKKSDGKVVLEYNNTDKRLNRRNLEIINIIIEHSIYYKDYISLKEIVEKFENKGIFDYDKESIRRRLIILRHDSDWESVLLHSADGYMIDNSAIAEISYGSYTKYCLYSDENLPKYYNLSYGDSFIGRDTRKTQFCICDSSLNMLHAKLTVTENEIWIYDINSTNGTYVNEQRISDCIQIHVGDRIRFGNVEYILKEIAGVLVSGTDTKIIEYGINIVGRESFTKKADDNINISIDSESVSLLHAIITAKDGHVSVRDLNSANGTFVNGNRIFGDTLIYNKNTISFAGSEYVFRTHLDYILQLSK